MRTLGAKIVTAWVLCSLIMAGGLILTLSRPSADGLTHESTVTNPGEQLLRKVFTIGPSPFLLFAMGGLGIGCVLVNERQRCRNRLNLGHGDRRASEPRMTQDIHPS